jgi:hypothetical protein
MNEARTLLIGQYDIASKKVASAGEPLPAEAEMVEFLRTVRAHPQERAFVFELFKRSLTDRSRPSNWEFIQFCIHALRWEEMREFLTDLVAKAVKANDWRGLRIWNHLLDAFSDGWDDAELYKEFSGGCGGGHLAS